MFVFELIKALIRICTIFLAILVWTRYFEANLTKALVISAIGTLLLDSVLHLYNKKVQGKKTLTRLEQELCENIALEFMLSPNKKVTSYFEQLINKTTPCEVKKQMIVAKSQSFRIIVYPFYSCANFMFEHLLEVIQNTKTTKPNRVIVCAYNISDEAKNFARNFSEYELFLLDRHETFSLLIQPQKFYPEINPKTPNIQKTSIKTMLATMFHVKRAKTFFMCGLALFLGSLILRHNLYYVVMSSLLMTFALIALLSPKWAKQKQVSLLD